MASFVLFCASRAQAKWKQAVGLPVSKEICIAVAISFFIMLSLTIPPKS